MDCATGSVESSISDGLLFTPGFFEQFSKSGFKNSFIAATG